MKKNKSNMVISSIVIIFILIIMIIGLYPQIKSLLPNNNKIGTANPPQTEETNPAPQNKELTMSELLEAAKNSNTPKNSNGQMINGAYDYTWFEGININEIKSKHDGNWVRIKFPDESIELSYESKQKDIIAGISCNAYDPYEHPTQRSDSFYLSNTRTNQSGNYDTLNSSDGSHTDTSLLRINDRGNYRYIDDSEPYGGDWIVLDPFLSQEQNQVVDLFSYTLPKVTCN